MAATPPVPPDRDNLLAGTEVEQEHVAENSPPSPLSSQRPGGEFSPFPATERVLAGRRLAELGDLHPGVGLRNDGLPDIAWREVPAGTFLMGSDKKLDSLAYDDEMPQHEVTVPTFKMARYPVTNAQYQAFVDDGGYSEQGRNCWTDAGWKWKKGREKPMMAGGNFDLSNHPVVYVTWYEVMAFCDWLAIRLRNTAELPGDLVVRLPSEAEWEYAARGPEGHIYPWGHDITPEHANYNETNFGETSAVGCFPHGVSLFSGCEEMAGNVWEWCCDEWYDSYDNAPVDGQPRVTKGEEKRKVMRGGSWFNDSQYCRCAIRSRYDPGTGSFSCGFRVVVGVPWT